MGNKYFRTALLVVLMAATSGVVFSASNWTKEFTKNGISVYTRPIEGSSFKEFKGVGMIPASMEACQKVLMDIPNLTRWMPDCISAKLLSSSNGGSSVITYNETKTPWPVSNRDVVSQSKVVVTNDRITHYITAINRPDLAPLKSGNVRMTKMTAQWTLIRKGPKTLAIYQVRADPGGSLPAWLANKSSRDLPLNTLIGLKRRAGLPQYQGN
ncbi:MAG TPA: START domain-containing protein [Spirochaetota bacterium]|nr:START domain-containing protein [Spirochaetota bacterium]HPQ54853.1 START domain-containing protein [Spirochaetota bacterium]